MPSSPGLTKLLCRRGREPALIEQLLDAAEESQTEPVLAAIR